MTTTTTTTARTVWALGDYAKVADEVIPGLGADLTQAVRVSHGEHVLDVAAGSGNATFPAARAGARVVAADITPELLEAGRQRAAERGIPGITWREADAQALPFDDASFDVVLSCVGVMFAPDHQASASELLRVTRPGGRIGLAHWTPEGFIGQMFAVMKPYAPPPAPGATPPPRWGDERHVQDLFSDHVDRFESSRRTLRVDRFDSPRAFVDFFKSYYGPTIAVYGRLVEQQDRAAELDAALVDLAERFGAGRGPMEWEYLLVEAGRAS